MKTRHLSIALGPAVRRYLLVSLLAVLLLVATVGATTAGETVPCPAYKAGAWYRYDKKDIYNNVTQDLRKTESVDGGHLIGTRDGMPWIADKLLTNWQKFGERMAAPKYYTLPECPFSLGETLVYEDVDYDGFARGAKARGTLTVTVDPEFVPVTVKAGTFKAVKVVSENVYRSNSGWNGKARIESYYAPEVGMFVKSEFTEALPSERYRDRLELLEYSLGD